MGPTALLPLRRKACWGFFRPEKSWRLRLGLNPRTWVLKGSTLPLDHRSRLWSVFSIIQCQNGRNYKHADYTLHVHTGLWQRIQSLAWKVQNLTCKLIFFVSSAALAPSTLSNSEPPRSKRNVGTAEIEYFSDTSGKSSAGHFANLTAWNETPTNN